MADEKPQKISVGFLGSQVLSGRIVPAELAKLRDEIRDLKRQLDQLVAAG